MPRPYVRKLQNAREIDEYTWHVIISLGRIRMARDNIARTNTHDT